LIFITTHITHRRHFTREKESVRRQNHHTFLHRNERLEEEDKGKRRFVEERDFETFVKQFVEERPLKRRRLDLSNSLSSLSLFIYSSVVKKYEQ